MPNAFPQGDFATQDFIRMTDLKITKLHNADTTIYLADVSPLSDASLYSDLYNSVSPARRQKTDRLRFDKDKRLSLGAEYLFMTACKDFGVDYNTAELADNGYGKPVFRDVPIHFGLSHSENFAMCVMSEKPVGCDIEKIKKADMRVAERFFTGCEFEFLLGISEENARNEEFYRLWTMKESYIKWDGRGLEIPLNSFCVIGDDIPDGVDFFADRIGEYRFAVCSVTN